MKHNKEDTGKKGVPLRDWSVGSYDDRGRAVSGLSDTGHSAQMPSLPAAKDTYDASGSADGSRENARHTMHEHGRKAAEHPHKHMHPHHGKHGHK